MKVVALGSGSSGNSILVVADNTKVLLDAGLPTKAIERSLLHIGIDPAELSAIFLTHEHSDHVAAAGVLARRYRLPIVATEGTLGKANLGTVQAQIMPVSSSVQIGDLAVESFPLPHDGADPVGYCIEHDGAKICLATDLGYVSTELHQMISAADLVILEANHDEKRLLQGPYPPALKARIAGDRGHLSNQQAADCIVASASSRPHSAGPDSARPQSARAQWLWLAHLSAVNNSPLMALRTVSNTLRAMGIDTIQVSVASRDRRSLVWDSADCFLQLKMRLI